MAAPRLMPLHTGKGRTVGQAIDRMIDEDIPCEDILSQLNAAKSALNGCGKVVLCSLFGFQPLPFDMAWIAIVLCGVPIILEAVIGLVTAFDIKADVLVSLAVITATCIGETFAAGEVGCCKKRASTLVK